MCVRVWQFRSRVWNNLIVSRAFIVFAAVRPVGHPQFEKKERFKSVEVQPGLAGSNIPTIPLPLAASSLEYRVRRCHGQ